MPPFAAALGYFDDPEGELTLDPRVAPAEDAFPSDCFPFVWKDFRNCSTLNLLVLNLRSRRFSLFVSIQTYYAHELFRPADCCGNQFLFRQPGECLVCGYFRAGEWRIFDNTEFLKVCTDASQRPTARRLWRF